MKDFFIRESIYLRPLEPEDLDVLYKWENDTKLWQKGATVSPFSRFTIRQYLVDAHDDIFQTKQLRMMIVEKASNLPVGTVDLYDFDALNRRACIGILVDEDFQKKGYGLQALSCVEEYTFCHLKLHQIYAFIPEKNQASLALFSKANFVKTGVLKEWVSIADSYEDVVVMQLLKTQTPNPKPITHTSYLIPQTSYLKPQTP